MNSPDKNNYIQYVNKNGIVKARNVVFDNDGTTTKFSVSGIDEDFFIFSVYENNIQRFCVGLENLDNTDMLGFINSNMVDLSCIPHYAFLPSYTVVELSYNDEYVKKNKFGDGLVGSQEPVSDFEDSGNLIQRYETDDLRMLKSILIEKFGTLDGIYIGALTFSLHNLQSNYYDRGNSVLFGRIQGPNILYKDVRFSNPNHEFGSVGDGALCHFMSSFSTLEGTKGVVFTGYQVWKTGWV